jgi:hypothetical protein
MSVRVKHNCLWKQNLQEGYIHILEKLSPMPSINESSVNGRYKVNCNDVKNDDLLYCV